MTLVDSIVFPGKSSILCSMNARQRGCLCSYCTERGFSSTSRKKIMDGGSHVLSLKNVEGSIFKKCREC